MLAILTFVTTVVLGILPNHDVYNRTTKSFQDGKLVETKTEMISEWNFDTEKGWYYLLPDINVKLTVTPQTAEANDSETEGGN
ncbi:MAG: hypothetical protein GXO91_00685 [FCB group bacterium]|nr:hypothetical protein [FCB group bacterium]